MKTRYRCMEPLLHEHPGFERRWVLVERISWVLMAALLIAACAGITGPGLLSSDVQRDGAGRLSVSYEKRLHNRLPARITVDVWIAESQARLAIEGELMRSFQSSNPPAVLQERTPATLYLTYRMAGSPARIELIARPEHWGPQTSRIALTPAAPVIFHQVVFP